MGPYTWDPIHGTLYGDPIHGDPIHGDPIHGDPIHGTLYMGGGGGELQTYSSSSWKGILVVLVNEALSSRVELPHCAH